MSVYILAAARTPLGAFGGSLRTLGAVGLGVHALRETLRRASTAPDRVSEVILGCALPAGCGGHPARSAALAAGLPAHAPALTVCAGPASGLKAATLAAEALQRGAPGPILAGGIESPSRAPYLVPEARWGVRVGEAELLDSLLLDGPAVAQEAEELARRFALAPAALAAWSDADRRKALSGRAGRIREIAPLFVEGKRGSRLLPEDEPPEASPIPPKPGLAAPADGAAALLLASELPPGLSPMARVLGWTEAGPGPATAIRQLLHRTGLRCEEIDRWEFHEPSAAHALALLRELPELDPAKVNASGGALALGDPWGASGARMLVSLVHGLQASGLRTGIAAVPAAHGPTLAMAITRC